MFIFDNNYISAIKRMNFKNFNFTNLVDVSNNMIYTIEEDTFINQNSLRKVDIGFN